MTRMTTMARATRSTLAVIAMASTALTLSACNILGGGGSSAAGTASSASASASTDAGDSAPTDGNGNGVRSKPSSDATTPAATKSPTASASPSASASGGASAELAEPVTPPEGYQTATAEKAGITFALPADWSVYSTLDDAEIAEIAARLETDTSTVSSSTRLQDLLAIAGSRDSNGLLEHATCISVALPLGVVSEETMTNNVTEDGSTVEKYSTVDTANGTGSYLIYNDATYDGTVKTADLYLPNPAGSMVLLRVSSSSTERTQQLVDTVTATLR
ncbi:MAG: hypothetical protein Q4E00_04985 [Actinomyces bowdenii]|nr:hypothetical protein [Actinomyces bowdenii]